MISAPSTIRALRQDEHHLLNAFLYEVIFIPAGVEKPPRSIVEELELRVYVDGLENSPHDRYLVAEVDGRVVGCYLTRIMDDYGHIDDKTPSFLISKQCHQVDAPAVIFAPGLVGDLVSPVGEESLCCLDCLLLKFD